MKNNIIIAGVPRAGKSTVSHILSQEYGYQHVSMDSIIAGFEKCFPEIGVSTYQGLSSLDTLRVISCKMAPFVRAMLDSGEYDEFAPGMVLDMYQLLPEDYDKYGMKLMMEIEDLFHSKIIKLDTPIWNEHTNRFYKKCGYTEIGRDDESVYYEKRASQSSACTQRVL